MHHTCCGTALPHLGGARLNGAHREVYAFLITILGAWKQNMAGLGWQKQCGRPTDMKWRYAVEVRGSREAMGIICLGKVRR